MKMGTAVFSVSKGHQGRPEYPRKVSKAVTRLVLLDRCKKVERRLGKLSRKGAEPDLIRATTTRLNNLRAELYYLQRNTK